MSSLLLVAFWENLYGSNLSSSDTHSIHQRSIQPLYLIFCIPVGPDRGPKLPCSILSHGETQSHFPESTPSSRGQSSSVCWRVQVFDGSSGRKEMWCGRPVSWNRARRPSFQGHTHRPTRFPLRREAVRTRWGSGRGSSWNGSFQEGTRGCSSASREDLWFLLFWWLAWVDYK